MDTKEYFEELIGLENDGIHPEFHTYAAAWIRSRSPYLYSEVIANFKAIQGEIYAKHECDAAKAKF